MASGCLLILHNQFSKLDERASLTSTSQPPPTPHRPRTTSGASMILGGGGALVKGYLYIAKRVSVFLTPLVTVHCGKAGAQATC